MTLCLCALLARSAVTTLLGSGIKRFVSTVLATNVAAAGRFNVLLRVNHHHSTTHNDAGPLQQRFRLQAVMLIPAILLLSSSAGYVVSLVSRGCFLGASQARFCFFHCESRRRCLFPCVLCISGNLLALFLYFLRYSIEGKVRFSCLRGRNSSF